MDGLDLLKKDWKKRDNIYPKLSYDEIYGMILKKSSSIVKWIFYISAIEFSLGLILIIINPTLESQVTYPKWLDVFSYTAFPVAVYFIILFYRNYKNISTTDNAKKLMQSILKTRKTVKYYIIFNLIFSGVFFAMATFIAYTQISGGIEVFNATTDTKTYVLTVFVILLITAVFLGLIYGVYYLLYGILLKRLNHNYKELKGLNP